MPKMAKKKESSVVYSPIGEIPTQILQTPQKIDIPQYPDVGISFAGYSKSLYSGNIYKLNPQDRYIKHGVCIWGAGITAFYFDNLQYGKKDVYITDIIIYNHPINWGSLDYFSVQYGDGTTNETVYRFPPQLWTDGINPIAKIDTKFTIALKIPKTALRIYIVASSAPGNGSLTIFNFYGWAE